MIPFLSRIARPYIRHELPGWGKVYNLLVDGSAPDERWAHGPKLTVRGKLHGYDMDVDLSQWSERRTYFLGRFYDLPLQMLALRVVRPGDRVVDIGANIGMISLLLARIVGPEGMVDSFEPNPACAERIRTAIRKNRISSIRLHEMGLAGEETELTLCVPTNSLGQGSFGLSPRAEEAASFQTYTVPVRIGDRVLGEDHRPIVLIKIDVEGFEYHVLHGLQSTLRRDRPAVVTEVSEEYLSRAGSSAKELDSLMRGLGYAPHEYDTRRRGINNWDLFVKPTILEEFPDNVLWIPLEGPNRPRFDSLLRGNWNPPE